MTSANETWTITEAPRRAALRVVGVGGGPHVVHRLASLGVVPGAQLSVLQRRGVLIIGIGDGRIALGQEAAAAVTVKELSK